MSSHRRPFSLPQYGLHGSWLNVLEDYQIGQDVQATVVGMIEYGMLVKLETGVVALLHRKEIDWISTEPLQVLQKGERVSVRILSIDPDRQRMSVSRRVLLPNPRDAFVQTAQVGTVYLGRVTKCMDYGAFVEIAPGVRGLLHISEMTVTSQEPLARAVCSPGESFLVRVIGIDHDIRRISLDLA